MKNLIRKGFLSKLRRGKVKLSGSGLIRTKLEENIGVRDVVLGYLKTIVAVSQKVIDERREKAKK